ncbi:MAG: hypothetical protein ABSH03_04245 [Candidatus Lustribacter sp.]
MPFVVTGISQDGNTAPLEAALKAAGLTLDALEVLGPDDADEAAEVRSGTVDTSILTGGGLDTGTGVPGLTGGGIPGVAGAPRLADVGGESLWERLADLAIPDDEVENYAAALETGKSIVAFHGDSKNVAKVEALFGSNGLTKVKTF